TLQAHDESRNPFSKLFVRKPPYLNFKMPTFNDITTFLGGQIFGQMSIPEVDLSNKTFVVTGANTGLGLECVKHLVHLKASKVILACRDVTKGGAAVSYIRELAPDSNTELEVWCLDLACYESVQAFANKVTSTDLTRLDGFVANAGVEVDNYQLSGDIELTIKVNIISTFMLALAILPKLRATMEQFQDHTRLTIVGSLIHNFGPDSQLDLPEKPSTNVFDLLSEPDRADMAQRYPLSKLMGHLCSRELARYVTEQNVTASCQVIVNW
ncbi:hypothetical protein Golomagni_07560, partial [Golovinomyces magnicellulatus]